MGSFSHSDIPQLKHRFHHGLAIGDVNGDGLEDVYVCQPKGFPNPLFLHQSDGSVREAGAQAGVEDQSFGMSVSWGDPNRDWLFDFYIISNVHSFWPTATPTRSGIRPRSTASTRHW